MSTFSVCTVREKTNQLENFGGFNLDCTVVAMSMRVFFFVYLRNLEIIRGRAERQHAELKVEKVQKKQQRAIFCLFQINFWHKSFGGFVDAIVSILLVVLLDLYQFLFVWLCPISLFFSFCCWFFWLSHYHCTPLHFPFVCSPAPV